MSDPVGVGGGWFPPGHERAQLVAELGRYLALWEQRLRTPGTGPRLDLLREWSAHLQAPARAVGFGGVAHHLSRCHAILHAAGPLDVGNLGAALKDLSELAWQAKQELTPDDRALVDRALGEPLPAHPSGGSAPPSSLEPPPMLTVHPDLWRGAGVAFGAAETGGPPEPPRIVSPIPPAPPGFRAAPAGPSSALDSRRPIAPAGPKGVFESRGASAPPVAMGRADVVETPPPSERARPHLAVRTMFRLRAFGQPSVQRLAANEPHEGGGRAPPPGGASPMLGLRGFSNPPPAPPVARGAPGSLLPRLLNDSLPPLPGAGEERVPTPGPSGMSDLLARVGPKREPSARAQHDSKGAVKGPRRRQAPRSSFPWWLGVLAALAAGVLTLVAVLSWNRLRTPVDKTARPAASGPSSAPSGAAAASNASVPTASPALETRTPTDETLEDIRQKAHGRGKESPELRAWVDHQAALQAKLLETGKCEGSAAACAILYRAGEDTSVPRGKIVPKKTPSPTNTARSRWLYGLKPPSIPVEDEPRVKYFFEKYTVSPVGREQFQQMLFRCGAYRDLIQATLIRYDLPPSLLAVVYAESGCLPTIRSPVGAEGLWQFMPEAGRAYHLHITEDVLDERHSPRKSTEAAIHFLADLYAKFGSWDLAFAAYNMGPYGLHARMQRAGGDVGFWDLFDAGLLPSETSDYVPVIEAIALILENLPKLKFSGPTHTPEVTGDLEAPPGTRLGLIARAASTSVNQIHALNLDLKADFIPTIPGQRFVIQVPQESVWQARDVLGDLLGSYEDQCVPDNFDWGRQPFNKELKDECRRRLGAPAGQSSHTPLR